MDRTHRTIQWAWLLAASFALPLSGTAQAQFTVPPAFPVQPIQRVHELIGRDVQEAGATTIGRLDRIIAGGDRLLYALVSPYGTLPIGNRYLIVPWGALQVPLNGSGVLRIPVGADRLMQAPNFLKTDWPDLAGEESSRLIHGFYGLPAPPALAAAGSVPSGTGPVLPVMPLLDLFGRKVLHQGQEIGAMDDLAVDVRSGRIQYGVLAFGGAMQELSGYQVVVPWNRLTLQSGKADFGVAASLDTLRGMAFEEGQFPNLANARYAQLIRDRFNAEPNWQTYGFAGSGGAYSRPEQPVFTGKVVGVSPFVPYVGTGQTAQLTLLADDGRRFIVRLAPWSFVNEQGATFQEGDRISVEGTTAQINDQVTILASEVLWGDQTLRLRDELGRPLWLSEARRVERPVKAVGSVKTPPAAPLIPIWTPSQTLPGPSPAPATPYAPLVPSMPRY